MSNQHPEFYRHYSLILQEEFSKNERPATLKAFRETLLDRCPYLSEAERDGILSALPVESLNV